MFQNLVKIAMGQQKQNEFADKAGISKFHLNRLLNNPDQNPSKSTLQKIADASDGRVSFNQLYAACHDGEIPAVQAANEDYSKEYHIAGDELFDLTSVRQSKLADATLKTKISLEVLNRVLTIKNAITSYCGQSYRYISLHDVFASIRTIYHLEDIHCSTYGIDHDTIDAGHRNAEEAAHVIAQWGDENFQATFSFVLYYCKTEKGGIILSEAVFDLPSLLKVHNPVADDILFQLASTKDAVTSDYKIVYKLCYSPALIDEECTRVSQILELLKSIPEDELNEIIKDYTGS